MMNKAWSSIEKVPYWFSSSSVKFQGHTALNALRPRQNGRHFPCDIFKCIFFSENVWISLNISLRFVPNGPINNIPALVQIMAWCRPGDKPLSQPMMVRSLTHLCVTRPQWVKIVKFDADWAFPDCNSSLNSPMATKWYTKLEVA